MKIVSIFLAAVMVSALAGQAAEARDHDGWRNHQRRAWQNQRKAWRNYNKQLQRQQRWNYNNFGYYPYGGGQGGRPWDNAHDNSIRALQEIQRNQQILNAQRGWFWY